MPENKVIKVLLFLKNMVYESTSPMEILRFAKYYRKKGLDVVVVLWGPMGVILGKKGSAGRLRTMSASWNAWNLE